MFSCVDVFARKKRIDGATYVLTAGFIAQCLYDFWRYMIFRVIKMNATQWLSFFQCLFQINEGYRDVPMGVLSGV